MRMQPSLLHTLFVLFPGDYVVRVRSFFKSLLLKVPAKENFHIHERCSPMATEESDAASSDDFVVGKKISLTETRSTLGVSPKRVASL